MPTALDDVKLCKVRMGDAVACAGLLTREGVHPLNWSGAPTVSEILHAPDRQAILDLMLDRASRALPESEVRLLAPLDRQEVWAAGVTYKRSREARERESVGAARFYDLVYSAERPELFFKSNPFRVADPGEPVRIRRDSRWSVPEPELALLVSPVLEIVGYTIGNDMSARDIEGENPLYLPQAKVYDRCCALGPAIALGLSELAAIRLHIERNGSTAFEGSTDLAAMKRGFEDLVSWLGREATFPDGAVLLTGTGVVPPDEFTLLPGDVITIAIEGIGELRNVVEIRQIS
jgi:2-dehydro-3-deoxy-D-arabinonate dehydratase